MKVLGVAFFLVNFATAVLAAWPCLALAAMAQDSPSSQSDPVAIASSFIIATWPVVLFLSGVASLSVFWKKNLAMLGLIPWVEAGALFAWILVWARFFS